MSGDNKVEEDNAGETLEEAGALEADVGANFDQQLAGIDPRLKIDMDPFAHRDLRPEMMFIREELRQAKWQTLAFMHPKTKSPVLQIRETGAGLVFWELVITGSLPAANAFHTATELQDVRRTALKKLLLKDFMQEDCELRNIGLAYAPPDP